MNDIDLRVVHNLLGRYGLLLDRLDVEEWLDLFTDDAVLDIDGTELDSREKRRHLTTTAPRGVHVVNHPVITGDPATDSLSATATFLFRSVDGVTVRLGWYDDRLERVGDQWRFTYRRISFLD